jgi:hypothetical protein
VKTFIPVARAGVLVAAFIATAFVQDDAEAASKQWRQIADQALGQEEFDLLSFHGLNSG